MTPLYRHRVSSEFSVTLLQENAPELGILTGWFLPRFNVNEVTVRCDLLPIKRKLNNLWAVSFSRIQRMLPCNLIYKRARFQHKGQRAANGPQGQSSAGSTHNPPNQIKFDLTCLVSPLFELSSAFRYSQVNKIDQQQKKNQIHQENSAQAVSSTCLKGFVWEARHKKQACERRT